MLPCSLYGLHARTRATCSATNDARKNIKIANTSVKVACCALSHLSFELVLQFVLQVF